MTTVPKNRNIPNHLDTTNKSKCIASWCHKLHLERTVFCNCQTVRLTVQQIFVLFVMERKILLRSFYFVNHYWR